MLTLKKLGLMTTALFAAFTISTFTVSCSDDGNEDGDSSSSAGNGGDAAYWSFTLSNAGESYADIDGKKTYKQADVGSHAEDIDLVAYHTGASAGEKLYGPGFITITKESLARIFTTKNALCAALDDDTEDGRENIPVSEGDEIFLESSASKPTDLKLFSVTVKAIGTASMDLEANVITCN